MINLLPPDIKAQVRYSKLNRLMLRYANITVAVVVVLVVIFGGAIYLLKQQTDIVAADVADKKQTIAGLTKTFLPKAKDASERLNAIKYVQTSQTRFSLLIADIAKVQPQGVSIDTLTLTGDDKMSVRVVASTTTYDQALAFRNALITSPRIAGVDIESLSKNDTPPSYHFKVSAVIGFKPGQAR